MGGPLGQDGTVPYITYLPVVHVIEVLEFCLWSAHFVYDGQIFSLVDGAVMGSS